MMNNDVFAVSERHLSRRVSSALPVVHTVCHLQFLPELSARARLQPVQHHSALPGTPRHHRRFLQLHTV